MAKCVLDSTPAARLPIVINRCVNLVLACLFLVPAVVIVAALYLLSCIVEKRPRSSFFYSGDRMGYQKKLFKIYKIRSLRDDPEFEKKGIILPAGSNRELVMGKFLRESRLDELPQLWNVIVGDMNLVGPRPLRPAVYEQMRQEMTHCVGRFRVKPGLTGYSQFLTPSRTPKRLRFAIDNYFINQGYRPGRDLVLVVWTMWMVLRRTFKATVRRIVARWRTYKTRGHVKEERLTDRHQSKNIWIQMADIDFSEVVQEPMPIYDINERAVSFLYEGELESC